MGDKPIYKENAGAIGVSVFENKGKTKEGKDFVFKTINLQKSYKDKDGKWQNLNLSMRVDDIPKVRMLLGMAYQECSLREKGGDDTN